MGPAEPIHLLVIAAKVGFVEFIAPLLQHIRSKGVRDGDVAQHLAEAAYAVIEAGFPLAGIKAFAEQGLDLKPARVNMADDYMIPLFHAACQSDRKDVAAFLLARGCDPKELDQ